MKKEFQEKERHCKEELNIARNQVATLEQESNGRSVKKMFALENELLPIKEKLDGSRDEAEEAEASRNALP